jgi:UDP-N-acetylglucosamine--N-acetylmuramyl-(pentapeptide) pyrophosphoryl-undecaprenol N-acetylglucosamine transferase
VVSYTEQMAEALAAADLVIARAGASTLAELTAVGRAAVLMPYPFHRDQHQMANAECLVRMGAARIVRDAVDPTVNAAALRGVLEELMNDDGKRAAMANAARRMGRSDAAETIAGELLQLARIRTGRRGARIGGDDPSAHPINTRTAPRTRSVDLSAPSFKQAI